MVENAVATAALSTDISSAQNVAGESGFLGGDFGSLAGGLESGDPKGLSELLSNLGDPDVMSKLAESGIMDTANQAFGAAHGVIEELMAQNPEILNRGGSLGNLADDVLGVQGHLDQLQSNIGGLIDGLGAQESKSPGVEEGPSNAQAALEGAQLASGAAPEGAAPAGVTQQGPLRQDGKGEEEAVAEEGAALEGGVVGGEGIGQLDPTANGGGEAPPTDGAAAAGNNAAPPAPPLAAAPPAEASPGGASAGGNGGGSGGGPRGSSVKGNKAPSMETLAAVVGTKNLQGASKGASRKGAPAKSGGGGLRPLAKPGRATAPGGGGGGGSVTAASPSVSINAGDGAASGQKDLKTEANFTYDLPGALQNVAPPASSGKALDLTSTPSNIGKGLTPDAASFEAPKGNIAPVNSLPGGGASLTETGVEASAASKSATVSAETGTIAGRGKATGGAAQVTPTQTGLNPSVNTAMAATTAPDVGALEFQERAAPEGGSAEGEQAGSGGGEVSLAAPSVPNLSYGGAGKDQMAPVPAAALPDYASAATATAQSALDAKAAELEPIGPAAEARVSSEIAPKQAEGKAAIDSGMANYKSQVAGFDASQQEVITEAGSKSASATAEQAAIQAAAQSKSATESAEFSKSPVPAELENASNTIKDIVALTSDNALSATSGKPMIELPGEAIAGMEAAASDMDRFTNDFVSPDLAADFGAMSVPDHGLDIEAFETLVDPSGFVFDTGKLPAGNTSGASGGGMNAEVEAAVMAKLEPAVAKQQDDVRAGLGNTGSEGLEQLREEAQATYDEGASFAESAIADWEAIDIDAEVSSANATALDAAKLATTENQAHITDMTGAFNNAQTDFDADCVAGTDAFASEIDTATGAHSSSVTDASSAYDAAIVAADNALRTGHDAALGEHQGKTLGAIEGAQNTFAAEQELANTSLKGHQSQISAEMSELQAEAARVGSEASAQFEAEFQAQQNFAKQEQGRLVAAAEAEVSSLNTEGNAEIQAELEGGQKEAQSQIDSAVSSSNQDIAAANQEASSKMQDAQKEPGVIDKIVGWLQKQVNAALDWIKSRFDAVKNAINSALESAKNAALGILEAAKNAALAVLDRIRSAIQAVVSKLAEAINSVIDTISTALQAAVQTVTDFVNNAIQTVTDSIKGAIEGFRNVVNGMIDGFVNVVALIDEDLGAKLDAATQDFQDTFNGLVDTAQSAVTAASEGLQATVDAAGEELSSSIEAAENALQDKVTAAEEALNATVDMAFDTATAAIESTFDSLEATVEASFDAAQAAVTQALDTAYGAIEAGARALEEVVVQGLQKLDQAVQWVNENIVEPFKGFLADAWKGLQRFWVDFWNSAFRDILLGVALTALAVAITVATGGAGAPLAVMILASALGTGATAAAVYGAGELGAREANQSLTTSLETVDMSPDEIRNLSADEVKAMAAEQNVTWPGSTYIDPTTGQLMPDFTDPKNAWYADSMGDVTSDQDGGLTYTNDAGELVKLTPADMANMDPATREALAQQIYDKDENGNFNGESFDDSLRGSAALAAEKGIEHGINGAVTALTMGMAPGAGAGLATTGKVGLAQFARSQATSSAINATASVGTHALAGTVGEYIEDDRDSWKDAYLEGTKYDDLGDVALDWTANFGADFVGGMIGGASNATTHGGTYVDGKSTLSDTMQAGANVVTSTLQNSAKGGISTIGDNLIDDDKEWNDGVVDRMTSSDNFTQAIGKQASTTSSNWLGKQGNKSDDGRFTTALRTAGEKATGDVVGGVITTASNTAIDGNFSDIGRSLYDQSYYEEHPDAKRRSGVAPLSGQGIATSTASGLSDALKTDLQTHGVGSRSAAQIAAGTDAQGNTPYANRGMSTAQLEAKGAANYDALQRNVVGSPPGTTAPTGYRFRHNKEGEVIAVVRIRADDTQHAALTIDDSGNVAFGDSRNNSGDHPNRRPKPAPRASSGSPNT